MYIFLLIIVFAVVFFLSTDSKNKLDKGNTSNNKKDKQVVSEKFIISNEDKKKGEDIALRNLGLIKTFLDNININKSYKEIKTIADECYREILKKENRIDSNNENDLIVLREYIKYNFDARYHYYVNSRNNAKDFELKLENERRQRDIEQGLKNTNEINKLSGVEFEKYLSEFFKGKGYEVETTPTTGDQGTDLILKKNGKRISVQTKRYSGTVGNKAVQEALSGKIYYNCDESWVITNSTFSNSAKDLAEKSSVKLIDGTDLKKQIF